MLLIGEPLRLGLRDARTATGRGASPVINWPRMRELLQPRRGERFALVRDVVTGDMLLVDLELLYVVMSDSQHEQRLNRRIIEGAHGDMLLLGYGLGFIIQLLMINPAVTSITIIEKQQEVLDLVASQLMLNEKVRVVLADALEWMPDMQFDVIYDDCDYLPEDIQRVELSGGVSDNGRRLTQWIKPGGEFIRWSDPHEAGIYV